MRTVKAFACEGHEVEKFTAKNIECYQVGMKQAGYEAFISFFVGFAMNSAMAAIIYYGADLIDQGDLNIGDISMYLLYMIQLIFNFLTIGMVIGNVFKMFGASEKIIKMMKYLPTVNSLGGDTIPEDEVVGEIELRNVEFRYPTKADVTVCNNISLKVD